jgi:stalled ribosome rescue protein Dom34
VKEISFAIRRRWDGVACVIEVSPHAVCEDDVNKGHRHGTEAEMTASLSMRSEREYEQIDCGRIDEAVTEVSLPAVTVSLVDDGDERLLWSFDGIALRLGSRLGIDGKCASTELRVLATQIDDQHPRTVSLFSLILVPTGNYADMFFLLRRIRFFCTTTRAGARCWTWC